MTTPSEIAKLNARYFDGDGRRKPGRPKGSRPPETPRMSSLDLAIREYVERKAAVVALSTTDPGFRQAESEYRTAYRILKHHLKAKNAAYMATDGTRYAYRRHEDTIVVVPQPGRPIKSRNNMPVAETTDARELRRQEFARQAAEDHAAFAAEKSNEGGEKR